MTREMVFENVKAKLLDQINAVLESHGAHTDEAYKAVHNYKMFLDAERQSLSIEAEREHHEQ